MILLSYYSTGTTYITATTATTGTTDTTATGTTGTRATTGTTSTTGTTAELYRPLHEKTLILKNKNKQKKLSPKS